MNNSLARISDVPADAVSQDHPLRAVLTREMHVRGLPQISAPALALQWVVLVDEEEARQSAVMLHDWLTAQAAEFEASDRFIRCSLGDLHITWERHTEFMTFSVLAPTCGGTLFDLTPFAAVREWTARLPGRTFRSTQIAVVRDEPSHEDTSVHFNADDLIVSDVAARRARIWSDFRLHSDGFGQMLIQDKGLAGDECGQLLQRIREMGNYRKMALLGLPEARQATPLLSDLEQRLTAITTRISEKDADDEQILEELSSLGAELAQVSARTSYRMSATRAYAEICLDRIRRLGVEPVRGFRSLDDFTERRLIPAMRTCEAFGHRLENLAQRAAWTSSMLRTRVDTALARRNRDLLASMDRRTGLQLRLQHTVEGLSVVAVSYYSVGLIDRFIEALEELGPHAPVGLRVVLLPLIVATVYLGLRHIRKVKKL